MFPALHSSGDYWRSMGLVYDWFPPTPLSPKRPYHVQRRFGLVVVSETGAPSSLSTNQALGRIVLVTEGIKAGDLPASIEGALGKRLARLAEMAPSWTEQVMLRVGTCEILWTARRCQERVLSTRSNSRRLPSARRDVLITGRCHESNSPSVTHVLE